MLGNSVINGNFIVLGNNHGNFYSNIIGNGYTNVKVNGNFIINENYINYSGNINGKISKRRSNVINFNNNPVNGNVLLSNNKRLVEFHV